MPASPLRPIRRLVGCARRVRRLSFGSKGGDTLVQRQHRPCGVTEAPDRDLPPFGLASADHREDRDLGEGVFADLEADLLVQKVGLGAEAGGIERGLHLPGVAVGVAGDRGDDDLARRQPYDGEVLSVSCGGEVVQWCSKNRDTDDYLEFAVCPA